MSTRRFWMRHATTRKFGINFFSTFVLRTNSACTLSCVAVLTQGAAPTASAALARLDHLNWGHNSLDPVADHSRDQRNRDRVSRSGPPKAAPDSTLPPPTASGTTSPLAITRRAYREASRRNG